MCGSVTAAEYLRRGFFSGVNYIRSFVSGYSQCNLLDGYEDFARDAAFQRLAADVRFDLRKQRRVTVWSMWDIIMEKLPL